MTLKGRTALITGGTRRGIGATTAILMAAHGANLLLTYGGREESPEDEPRLRRFRELFRPFPVEVEFRRLDETRPEAVTALLSFGRERFGSIDILVNNSGGTWLEQDLIDVTDAHWRQAFSRDVDTAFYLTRGVLDSMRRAKWGRIINVGLDQATFQRLLEAQYESVLKKNAFDFILAKEAKAKFTELLAPMELRSGITVNNINPGIIEEIDHQAVLDYINSEGTVRPAQFSPIDLAETALFLCSESAAGLTGSSLNFPGNIYSRLC